MYQDFSEGSVGGHIVRQAVPLTVAYFIQLLYNVVDRIYIGHLPGTGGTVLTGLGLAFPVISLVAAFTNLFSTGGAPLFAIARGAARDEKKEEERASFYLNQTMFMLIVSSVLLTMIFYLIKKPLLYWFGASDLTYPYANDYLSIYLLGTVFLMFGTGMNPFINAQGYPKIGMRTVITGALLNIALDPLFIFVFHMGIQGAAIATVISQIVSASLVYSFFRGKNNQYPMRKERMIPRQKYIIPILGLGVSGFIMEVTNGLVQIICNVTLRDWGSDLYIGVMTIINSVRELLNIAIVGITNGAKPVISFNYGARKMRRVQQSIRITMTICLSYTLIIWAIIMIAPQLFIGLFSDSKEMVNIGKIAMRFYFSGIFFMAFQFVGQTTFGALGKAGHAVFFSLLRKVIIVIPLTIFLPHVFSEGVNGVFFAEPVSNCIGGLACFLTMLHVVRKEITRNEELR